MSDAVRGLRWTKTPPAEPVWYWMHHQPFPRCTPVVVFVADGCVYYAGDGDASQVSEALGCVWAGPLTPPGYEAAETTEVAPQEKGACEAVASSYKRW